MSEDSGSRLRTTECTMCMRAQSELNSALCKRLRTNDHASIKTIKASRVSNSALYKRLQTNDHASIKTIKASRVLNYPPNANGKLD